MCSWYGALRNLVSRHRSGVRKPYDLLSASKAAWLGLGLGLGPGLGLGLGLGLGFGLGLGLGSGLLLGVGEVGEACDRCFL